MLHALFVYLIIPTIAILVGICIGIYEEHKHTKKYREALEYYAHPDHYEPFMTMSGPRQPGVLTEGGYKARSALNLEEDHFD